jgi:AraC-like DNA-binding protein
VLATNALRAGSAESRISQVVDRWQVLGCEIRGTRPTTVIARIRALADDLPPDPSPIELVAIRSLLTRVFGEVARSCGSADRADVSVPFMAWAASSATATSWREDLFHLLYTWRVAFAGTDIESVDGPQDPRLDRAVRFLDEHFRNSSLSLADLAAAIQLSKYHTSRFLCRATGRGFRQHVHSRRITESQRLLRTTLRSVKEIASTVGYADSSQLGRYVKRVTGMTPREYRQSSTARMRDK